MASSLPAIAVAHPVDGAMILFLTRVNELGDSFNIGIIEHGTSCNIADSYNSHEQPKSHLAIHTSRYSDFYKSHDGGNMITRNLEQLIIPQLSVPHKTT